jgi:hypothetical protein
MLSNPKKVLAPLLGSIFLRTPFSGLEVGGVWGEGGTASLLNNLHHRLQ